jgi:hypothetical protein
MLPKVHTFISLALCALLQSAIQQSGTPQTVIADCPTVKIKRYQEKESGDRRYVLGAQIAGADPRMTPTYKWCISAGTITSGKGTYEIEIDAAGVKDEGITVTVMIGGFPWPCDNVAVYKITLPEGATSQAAQPNNDMHPATDTKVVNSKVSRRRVNSGVSRAQVQTAIKPY